MRRLTIKKETLAELTPADLTAVVGGGTQTCAVCSDLVSCFPTADRRDTCRCVETLAGC